MRIAGLTIAFFLCSIMLAAQSRDAADSIAFKMCQSINAGRELSDSVRVMTAYLHFLYPYVETYPADQRAAVGTSIVIRLQRTCPEFIRILNKLQPPKGDWEVDVAKPVTKLSADLCRQFFQHEDFIYLEPTGDSVRMRLADGFWIDTFKDGTTSRLKAIPVSPCVFEIEFIESDNFVRKSFSKPGDRYRYEIIDKQPKYYNMSVEIVGTAQYQTFKLYYKQ